MYIQDFMNEPDKINYLHPELKEKMAKLIIECERRGIKIRFSEGFRSVERQNELYEQGRTKPGNIVTNAKGDSYQSQHQWGIAVDFYLNMDVDGDGAIKDDAFNNSKQTFNRVGVIANMVGLAWGGNWKNPDMPHLYLGEWGSTTKILREGYGTYEKFRNTWEGGDYIKDLEGGGVNVARWDEREWVRKLQRVIGAKEDGIAGRETLSKTPTISSVRNRKNPAVGAIQSKLNHMGFDCGKVDGIAGKKFDRAARKFQISIGFKNPDGEFTSGKRSWKALLGIK